MANLSVQVGSHGLPGTLAVPHGARGLVVFAHGSGSSRHSPRNRAVADALQGVGCATLLFDVLTDDEGLDRANVFDIPLLGQRVIEAVAWVRTQPLVASLPVGLFGASTGAAAALWCASSPGTDVSAVVSRGGRPDLCPPVRLARVRAPTLLIVGAFDHDVLALNEQAASSLNCQWALQVVPGATHLFEEPGTMEEACQGARRWFAQWLWNEGGLNASSTAS